MLWQRMKPDELPRVPQLYIKGPDLKLKDLQPGQRAIIFTNSVRVDKEHHAWINENSFCPEGGPLAGITSRVEHAESGFILWLDRKAAFQPSELSAQEGWAPIVEFRELGEEE